MRPSRLRTGIIFIGLGVALLMFNMDRLDGYYFADLIRLWPILLIAIGTEIMARHSNLPALGYLSPVLVAGAFIYAGYGQSGYSSDSWSLFGSEADVPTMRTTERRFQVDNEVQQARFYVDLYNGRMKVQGGAEPLGRGEFRSRGKVRTSITEDDGVAVVRIRQSGASRDDDAEFDVFVADNLPLTLDLKADDAQIDVDGQDLSVHTLYLEMGAGMATVTFGAAQESVWVQLSAGDADLNLRLPLGAGIRFEGPNLPSAGGFGDLVLEKIENRLETAGFDTSAVRFVFQSEKPLAKVHLETY